VVGWKVRRERKEIFAAVPQLAFQRREYERMQRGWLVGWLVGWLERKRGRMDGGEEGDEEAEKNGWLVGKLEVMTTRV